MFGLIVCQQHDYKTEADEAVYSELYSRMGPNMPKMLAPETAGFSSLSTYINSLIDRDHAYGYAHHLYNGGGSYDDPDGYIYTMIDFHNNYGDKPLLQTEYSKGGAGDVTTFTEAMNLAHLMHNALVFENVSAYCYWELFWTPPKGLISHLGETYAINSVYYAFKHYSAFTDPGWYVINTSLGGTGAGDLRMSAFKSPEDDQLTVVVLNKSTSSYNLKLTLNGFTRSSSVVYRSGQTLTWAHLGSFTPEMSLPPESITTIHGTIFSNCADVLSADYGLTSDIHPDCYVNYEDLKIITDYWLNSECDLYDDCGGADFEPTDSVVNFFDLSTFAKQWMWCNDPEDPNCTANW